MVRELKWIERGKVNQYEEELIKKFSNKLNVKRKTIEGLILYIKSLYVVDQIDPHNKLYKKKFERFKINCLNAISNSSKKNPNDLKIECYVIAKNSATANYYNDIEAYNYKELYVMIEYSTEYIDSNSIKLYNELVVFMGLSKDDIKMQTQRFSSYLLALNASIKN